MEADELGIGRKLEAYECDSTLPSTCCKKDTRESPGTPPCDILTLECSRLTAELAMSYVDTLDYMGASCFQSGANMKLVDEDLVEDNPYVPPAVSNIYVSPRAANTAQLAYSQPVEDEAL